VTVIDGDVLTGDILSDSQVDAGDALANGVVDDVADGGLLNDVSVLDDAVDDSVLNGETLDNLTVVGDGVDVLDGGLADEPLANHVVSDAIDGGILNDVVEGGILPDGALDGGLLNDVADVDLFGEDGVLGDGTSDGMLGDVDLIGDVADGGILNDELLSDGLIDDVVGLDLVGDGANDGSTGNGGLIGGVADGGVLPSDIVGDGVLTGDGPLVDDLVDLGDIALDDLLGIGRGSSPALPVPAPTTPPTTSGKTTTNNTTTIVRRVDHRVTYIRNYYIVQSQNGQRGLTTINRSTRGVAGFMAPRSVKAGVVATALPSAGSGHAGESPVRAETLAFASLLLAVAGAGARRISGGRLLS
jgi:hypothetical protein